MEVKVKFNDINIKEEKEKTLVKILMLKGEKGEKGDGDFNVIETVKVNGTALPVSDKSVNVEIPTNNSAFNNDSGYLVENNLQMVKTLNVENNSQITDGIGYARLNKIYGNTERNGTPSPSNPADINVVKGNILIEVSNSNNTASQEFALSLGNIELCKIENFQDYIYKNDNKWYKYSEIGKVILNGSETWSSVGTATTGKSQWQTSISNLKKVSASNQVGKLISDKYSTIQAGAGAGTYNNIQGISVNPNSYQIRIYDDTYNTSLDDFKTWLNTHNLIIYYALENPTYTEIIDETLVNQLNEIYNFSLYLNESNFSISSLNLLPTLNILYSITNRDFYSKEEVNDIVDNLKLNTKDYYFNNVADMKAASLKVGDIVKTLGYYSANNSGAGDYEIVNDNTLVDNGGSIIDLANGLKAKLLTINNTVNISQFGAKGDNTTNDYQAFQNALNCGYNIVLEKEKTYKIANTLRLKDNIIIDLNKAIINCTDNHLFYNFLSNDTFTAYNGNGNIIIKNGTIKGGCISLFHGENIIIENIIFKDSLNNHNIELCSCKDVYISECVFNELPDLEGRLEPINIDPCTNDSFPWVSSDSVMYDNTINYNINVYNCYFDGGENKLMQDGVGCHTNSEYHHLYINIHDNVIKNVSSCGVMLFGCDYSKVYNNTIISDMYGVELSGSHDCVYDNKITSFRETETYVILILANSELLSVYNNQIFENGTLATRYILFGEQVTSCSFIKVDKLPVMVDNSFDNNVITVNTNTIVKLTEFNKLILCVGAPSQNTYRAIELNSYYTRNFGINDGFIIPELNCELIINSNNQILINSNVDLNIRQIILEIK